MRGWWFECAPPAMSVSVASEPKAVVGPYTTEHATSMEVSTVKIAAPPLGSNSIWMSEAWISAKLPTPAGVSTGSAESPPIPSSDMPPLLVSSARPASANVEEPSSLIKKSPISTGMAITAMAARRSHLPWIPLFPSAVSNCEVPTSSTSVSTPEPPMLSDPVSIFTQLHNSNR